jgi:hypothetical protein
MLIIAVEKTECPLTDELIFKNMTCTQNEILFILQKRREFCQCDSKMDPEDIRLSELSQP